MEKKTFLVGFFVVILIAITAAGVILFRQPAELRGATYAEPYPPAPEFALRRADDSSFQLSQTKGDVVLLFFGYTSCPDVCPITLAKLKSALNQVDTEKAQRVKVVFVTVDPEHDTAQRVQEYANHFDEGFIGLSGSETELAKVWNEYGIFREVVQNSSATGYDIEHTARVTLIDQDGNLRASYSTDTSAEDIAHDLNLLLD